MTLADIATKLGAAVGMSRDVVQSALVGAFTMDRRWYDGRSTMAIEARVAAGLDITASDARRILLAASSAHPMGMAAIGDVFAVSR